MRLMKFANLETCLSKLLCFLAFQCPVRGWMGSHALEPALSYDALPSTCSSVTTLMGVQHPARWRCGITGVLAQVSSPPLCPCTGTCLGYIHFPVSCSVLEWCVQVKGSHLSPGLNVTSCFLPSILPGLLPNIH